MEVLSNEGFDQFVIPIPVTGATAVVIRDGDTDPSNDWSATQVNGSMLLTAPPGKNRLNWGHMFSVSFVARGAPLETAVRLRVAQAGSPSSYVVTGVLGPTVADGIFHSGFEAAP